MAGRNPLESRYMQYRGGQYNKMHEGVDQPETVQPYPLRQAQNPFGDTRTQDAYRAYPRDPPSLSPQSSINSTTSKASNQKQADPYYGSDFEMSQVPRTKPSNPDYRTDKQLPRIISEELNPSPSSSSKRPRRQDTQSWDDGPKAWSVAWFRETWVCWLLSFIQLIVFFAEIIKYGLLTGSPIQVKPTVAPMLGPSVYTIINMGGRFDACMHAIPNLQNATYPVLWPCPNTTTAADGTGTACTLSQLCGLGGVPNPIPGGSLYGQPAPHQWFRFITPIFIHAGIVHIVFNLCMQLTTGRDMERFMGPIRFVIIYFVAGIFGFVLGANFAGNDQVSCGCSGALFGLLAVNILKVLYEQGKPLDKLKALSWVAGEVVIALILGLLPGLDNFAHIGGLLMGLAGGIVFLRTPHAFGGGGQLMGRFQWQFWKSDPEVQEFQYSERELKWGQPPPEPAATHPRAWYYWWAVRAVAVVAAIVAFVLLLANFYTWRTSCSWCKYLSCIPVKDWCSNSNLEFTTTTITTSPNKRDLGILAVGELLMR